MKAQKIYEIASGFLYERDGEDTDSKFFSVEFINTLLAETFDCENSIRRFRNLPLLSEPPMLESLQEEVPYQYDLTRTALPYGLCAIFFAEAMDNYHEALYRNKYNVAVDAAHKFNEEE